MPVPTVAQPLLRAPRARIAVADTAAEAGEAHPLATKLPLLAGLDPADGQQLIASCSRRRCARGERLIEQGERSACLFFLLSGSAHLLRTDARGQEVILDVLRPGDHIGEAGLIDGQPATTTVRCHKVCEVLELKGATLAHFLIGRPALAMALMQGLVARVRQARRQIASLALYSVPERIARQILELAVLQADGSWAVPERLSRSDLARMVGASREMASRAAQDLVTQGLIEIGPDDRIVLKRRDPAVHEGFPNAERWFLDAVLGAP